MKMWGLNWLDIETKWTDDQWFAFLERAAERLDREHKSMDRAKNSKAGGNRVRGNTTQKLVKKINEANARKAGAVSDGD